MSSQQPPFFGDGERDTNEHQPSQNAPTPEDLHPVDLRDHRAPAGLFPRIGGADLNPFGDPFGGGMLFDPEQRHIPHQLPRPGAPIPGARFDPVLPFAPRGLRGPDPDHAQMPNRGWNDPFI